MEGVFISKRLEEAKRRNESQLVTKSNLGKSLTWILRHGAIDSGLYMSTGGYVLCISILNLPQFRKFTLYDIKNTVYNSNKKRYVLLEKNNQLYIKAIMGHTGKVLDTIILEDLYVKIIEPLNNIFCNIKSDDYFDIIQSGLKINKRWNIEFATENYFNNIDFNGISVYIDMKLAMDDGIEFFMAENNIIISKGIGIYPNSVIDTKYITNIIDQTTGDNLPTSLDL